jgi:hypothetical protein
MATFNSLRQGPRGQPRLPHSQRKAGGGPVRRISRISCKLDRELGPAFQASFPPRALVGRAEPGFRSSPLSSRPRVRAQARRESRRVPLRQARD